jgi:prolyl oligopeptidase
LALAELGEVYWAFDSRLKREVAIRARPREPSMKYRDVALVPGFILSFALSAVAAGQAPPVAPVRPVMDTYFGVPVVDPYRWVERADNAELDAWMRAQNRYTRSLLDRLPGRKAVFERINALSEAGTLVEQVTRAGDRWFYMKQAPGDENGKLCARDGLHGRERILVDPSTIVAEGPHHAIDYFVPSLDGSYVAYGLSSGGSEQSVLHVVESATGKALGESIDRVRFGLIAWRPDGRSFFYPRFRKLDPDAPLTDKYLRSRVYLHTLGVHGDGDADEPVFGFGVTPRVPVDAVELGYMVCSPASPWVLGVVKKFVKNEIAIYAAPLDTIGRPSTPWTRVAGEEDEVVKADVRGDDIYLLTHKGASRYKILRTSLSKPDLGRAETVVPAGRAVLTNLGVAEDALYVQELDGGIGRVLRVPFGGGVGDATLLPLPFQGAVSEFAVIPRKPGVLMMLESWTKPPLLYEYDPATRTVADTSLRAPPPVDFSQIESREVKVVSYDGTLVPLSIVLKKGLALDGKNPTVLYAYGGYGISVNPSFFPILLAWLERGGVYAVAHVRGGGEFGEDWHLAGQKLTKLNTVYDFIACAEYLIDRQYTSRSRLGARGESAGGITVGRALTLRPELFAVILDEVGVSDTLRFERTSNGPPNVPELGTVATEEGFHGLYAMSPYVHVRDGTPYPAVLLTTGANDPRVAPWEAAKMAARLQAATSSGRPVLLRVDYDTGHGFGTTKSQLAAQITDSMSFALWQFGDPAFQAAP